MKNVNAHGYWKNVWNAAIANAAPTESSWAGQLRKAVRMPARLVLSPIAASLIRFFYRNPTAKRWASRTLKRQAPSLHARLALFAISSQLIPTLPLVESLEACGKPEIPLTEKTMRLPPRARQIFNLLKIRSIRPSDK